MTSLHDLLAMLNQAKQDLIDLDARISARRSEVEEMTVRFQNLGLNGTAERLHAAQRELDEARGVRSQMAASLEEASRLAVMAIGGTGGVAMRGATEEATDFEPATPTPSGEELLQSSENERRGFNAFTNRLFRDDATDPVKSISQSIQDFTGNRGIDLNPPESSMVTEVSQPTGPVIRADNQQVNVGDATAAGLAVAVALMKASQTVGSTISRFRQNRRSRE